MSQVFGNVPSAGYCVKCHQGYAVGPHICRELRHECARHLFDGVPCDLPEHIGLGCSECTPYVHADLSIDHEPGCQTIKVTVMELRVLESQLLDVEAQQRALSTRAIEIEQAILALKAAHKVGDTIEWGAPGKERRGIVLGFESWVCSRVTYLVRGLRKDGSEGAVVKVRPYDRPRPSSVAWLPVSADGQRNG